MDYFKQEAFSKSLHHLTTSNGEESYGHYKLTYGVGHYIYFDKETPTNYKHRHNFYEFCFVIRGEGLFKHGKETYPLKAGTLFIADPDIYHEISSFETKDLYLVFFSFSILEKQYKNYPSIEDQLLENFVCNHQNVLPNCHFLFHYLPLMNKANSNYALRAFMLESIEALTLRKKPTHNISLNKLEPILGYIRNHLDEKITSGTIAQKHYLSERHLRRLFKDTYNQTLHQYIMDQRLKLACARLSMGFQVKDVAKSIGMDDVSYFCRCFKRTYGMTPKEYKNHN